MVSSAVKGKKPYDTVDFLAKQKKNFSSKLYRASTMILLLLMSNGVDVATAANVDIRFGWFTAVASFTDIQNLVIIVCGCG